MNFANNGTISNPVSIYLMPCMTYLLFLFIEKLPAPACTYFRPERAPNYVLSVQVGIQPYMNKATRKDAALSMRSGR